MIARTAVRVVMLLVVPGAALVVDRVGDSRVAAQHAPTIAIPKAYADHDLRGWATPLPALGLRPGFFSEADFETIPAPRLYRSYPVYHPDREPPGYWEWLQEQPPKPLVVPDTLHTERDWIEAGRIVFRELYRPESQSRTELIPRARSRDALQRAGVKPRPDGTLSARWVVTPDGIRLAMTTCQSCHTRYMPDGTTIDGAPAERGAQGALLQRLTDPTGRAGATESLDARRAQVFQRVRAAVPWLETDAYDAITSMTRAEIEDLDVEEKYGLAILPRGGNGLFPTKTLDLNGVRDRKYLNHTATHLNRGVGDIMRYALNVECCDSGIFGPYRLRPNRPNFRYYDDVLFALAMYIYSLQPPPSPYLNDSLVADGERIFEREGCGECHTPPQYTNNKLTPAGGFRPPDDHPYHGDIMRRSVGTDPGRAMLTRVGTGFYRVPSLRGLWYRGLFGHAGDVASLEDWFDPARLRDAYVPSGWKGPKPTRAVPGHEFGLRLPAGEKRALIAFLKTL